MAKINLFDFRRHGIKSRYETIAKEVTVTWNETARYDEHGVKSFQRCYCELRYRDHVWCGVAILNPVDNYDRYTGMKLSAKRAAKAMAKELMFPEEKMIFLVTRTTRIFALKNNIKQPTEWEKEQYKDILRKDS